MGKRMVNWVGGLMNGGGGAGGWMRWRIGEKDNGWEGG